MLLDYREVISINGCHDSSVTFVDKTGELRIFEYERFVKKRYGMFSSQFDDRQLYGSNNEERIEFLKLIKENVFGNIKLILWHDINHDDLILLSSFFPNAEFEYVNHHESHAMGAIHQSNFDECLIFSIDGGGFDNGILSTTNVFLYKNGNLEKLLSDNLDFSLSYNCSASIIKDIRQKMPGDFSLAGKFMGITAYGEVIDEWIPYFKEFYKKMDRDKLCANLKLESCLDSSLSGSQSYNFARTSQHVFENELFNFVLPFIEKYNLNVIVTGGCALNVLFNQKLFEFLNSINLSLFVPSNPNDSGLSHGMFMTKFFNQVPKKEICFNGIHILDEKKFDLSDKIYEKFSINKVVEYIKDGKIIGIINENSEVGPRALGNRSIICYPAFKNMKDILNSKVKFREWFRPFAPVCKIEDKELFFENVRESKYMSFSPKVKKEYQEKLYSITHVDGTARLQTVENGNLFYDILTEMKNQSLIPVILNTSFNIKGYPILTTLKDAFFVLENTEMDYLIYKDKIYNKIKINN